MNKAANEWLVCLAVITLLQTVAKFLDDYHVSNKAKDAARYQLVKLFVFLDTFKFPDLSRDIATALDRISRRRGLLFWVVCGIAWLATPPWDSYKDTKLLVLVLLAAIPMAIWIGLHVRLICRLILRTKNNILATILALLVPAVAAFAVWEGLFKLFMPAYDFILAGVDLTVDGKTSNSNNLAAGLLFVLLLMLQIKLFFAIVVPVSMIALFMCGLIILRTVVNTLKFPMMHMIDSASTPTKSPFGYFLGATNVIIVLGKLIKDSLT